MNSFLKFQLPTILWAVVIFAVSSFPNLEAPDLGFRAMDKVYHLIEYGIFGLLLMRAFHYQHNIAMKNKALVLTLIVGILYAVSDEAHQLLIPGRNPALGDVLADSIGVFIGQWIYRKTFLAKKEVDF